MPGPGFSPVGVASVGTMASDVGLDQARGLLDFAGIAKGLGNQLGELGKSPHTVLDLLPGGGAAWPLTEIAPVAANLLQKNEYARALLVSYLAEAERGLAGLAYASAWVGFHFPATESANAEQLERLAKRGADAIPAPPDPRA